MMRSRLVVAFLVVLVAALALPIQSARSEPAQPPERPARDLRDANGDLWLGHLPQTTAQSAVSAPPAAAPALAGMNAWSRIVFQGARQNNWDLYVMTGPGSSQTRLTITGEFETYPRYNRGATAIAYSSNRSGNYDIWLMPPDNSTQTPLTSAATSDIDPVWSPDSSKIAFTSYRDGPAHIYTMNADGSNQRALTSGPAYHGQPAWSPDGARIAYVSTEGGTNGRIWVMNADGSNQTVLSYQNYGQHPVWSPDSQQIAYDTDGDNDGWQEMWLMWADGTNQHAIYKSSVYNTLTEVWPRSWSPDGRYIAFTRIAYVFYQGRWYWTWAHTEGLDAAHPNWSTITLSTGNEDWYPDWQSADTQPPTSRVNALPAVSAGPFTVTWGGADRGPAGIQYYDVQFKAGAGGSWGDWQVHTQATSASFPGNGGVPYAFRCRANDEANNLEAWPEAAQASTTVESQPPIVSLDPLPPFSLQDVRISWSGYDPGGSGIKGYAFQYQTDGGAWTAYPFDNTHTLFRGETGKTYHFRVMATDNANNDGAWTPDVDSASTTLYSWKLDGIVYDARRNRIADAGVDSWPRPIRPITTTANGRYTDYLSYAAATAALTVTQSGYTSPPALQIATYDGISVDHVLLPLDNQIKNGDFESRAWDGPPWVPPFWVGSVAYPPMMTTTIQHSGRNAALLGAGEFGPARYLSTATRVATNASAVARQGVVHTIWREQISPTNSEIIYARREATGSWSAPEYIANDNLLFDDPELAIDGTGALHVVWKDTYGTILYARRSPEGDWSSPLGISSGAAGKVPHIAAGSAGAVYVTWSLPDNMGVYYARRSVAGVWSAPLRVIAGPVTLPRMALDPGGSVHVVWNPWGEQAGEVWHVRIRPDGTLEAPHKIRNRDESNDRFPEIVADSIGNVHVSWISQRPNGFWVMYARRGADGVWSSSVEFPTASDTERAQMGVDGRNRVHIFLSGVYRQRDANGTWSAPETMGIPSPMTISAARPDNTPLDPRMTVGGDGAVHIIGPSPLSSEGVLYRRRTPEGDWLTWRVLSSNKPFHNVAQVVAEPNGVAHLFWEDGDGTNNLITYAGAALGSQSADSTLSQPVSVPMTLTNPTLSFLYQLNGMGTAPAGPFSVTVSSATRATTILSTTTRSARWTLAWADMTPWAGQIVTVTFAVHEEASRPVAWAALDDVSLGSWLTPAPQTIAPYQLDVWSPAVITVTGQNFSGPDTQVRLGSRVLTDTHWISTTMITATMPGLGLGIYDLVVTNPGGQAGGMERALTTGKRLYLPLIVSGR